MKTMEKSKIANFNKVYYQSNIQIILLLNLKRLGNQLKYISINGCYYAEYITKVWEVIYYK